MRPPKSGENEPDVIEFGIAAIAPQIERSDIEFPAEASSIVQALDDPEIPIDAHGNTVALSRAIDAVEDRRFDSEREFMNALHPILEERRERHSSSILASFRGLLPY